MAYVFEPAVVASVPVHGSADLFPVHRIYCVGRNYEDHAKEMGHTGREAPFFFMKPADAVLLAGADGVAHMPYPTLTSNLHHEVELVVAIGKGGSGIKAADAMKHIYGYAVGLDMTRRDLQIAAKKMGRPWEVGKGFDASAPCTPLKAAAKIGHPAKGRVWLNVNGEKRQEGDLADLIWSIPEMIAYLSGLFELKAGDLIMTGTPAGVGAIKKGDVMEGGVDGVGTLTVRVA